MKKKDTEKKLPDLFHGDLTPEEAEEINTEINETGITDEELESIVKVNKLIDKIPIDEPSSSMDTRFYEMLADETREALTTGQRSGYMGWLRSTYFHTGIRIAAGIALFLLGWFMSLWLGQRSNSASEVSKLSGEMKNLRETLVLTMLNQSSSLERIKAVNMVNEIENADDRIIQSLLNALNSDLNDNVRLLSLEALIKYSGNPVVRQGLVASIGNQSSPMIQLRLAEVMVALDEKRAAPEFQKIMTNAGLNYIVRNKLNEAISVLL